MSFDSALKIKEEAQRLSDHCYYFTCLYDYDFLYRNLLLIIRPMLFKLAAQWRHK
jgi:hypothetical protein